MEIRTDEIPSCSRLVPSSRALCTKGWITSAHPLGYGIINMPDRAHMPVKLSARRLICGDGYEWFLGIVAAQTLFD